MRCLRAPGSIRRRGRWSHLRLWYAGAGVTALLVLAALALFGFTTALAGRPALGKVVLEE